MDLFVHRMRLTHRLGGDAMVYHVPWEETVTGQQIADLLEALRRVEDLARELGVRIALENHYRAENDQRTFSAAFETFDPAFVGFTFDPGHALISGNTDWPAIMGFIAASPYTKPLQLEVSTEAILLPMRRRHKKSPINGLYNCPNESFIGRKLYYRRSNL